MKNDDKYLNCQDFCKEILPVGFHYLQKTITKKVSNKFMKPSNSGNTVKTRGFLYKDTSLIFSNAE